MISQSGAPLFLLLFLSELAHLSQLLTSLNKVLENPRSEEPTFVAMEGMPVLNLQVKISYMRYIRD